MMEEKQANKWRVKENSNKPPFSRVRIIYYAHIEITTIINIMLQLTHSFTHSLQCWDAAAEMFFDLICKMAKISWTNRCRTNGGCTFSLHIIQHILWLSVLMPNARILWNFWGWNYLMAIRGRHCNHFSTAIFHPLKHPLSSINPFYQNFHQFQKAFYNFFKASKRKLLKDLNLANLRMKWSLFLSVSCRRCPTGRSAPFSDTKVKKVWTAHER